MGMKESKDNGSESFVSIHPTDENHREQIAAAQRAIAIRWARDLLNTAKLLYANSEGCAVNHYGDDFSLYGLPGWLADAKASIDRAQKAIAAAEEALKLEDAAVWFVGQMEKIYPAIDAIAIPEKEKP